jgi:ABC-type Mn2+/Zn2+ transport system ATPase subunit
MDVSLTVSQVSRVAVSGANGAGKATAIKAAGPGGIAIG